MSCPRCYVVLRISRGWVKDRCIEGRLVLWLQAITATEDKVVLAKNNINGSLEEGRGSDNGAECEQFAESLRLFVSHADGEV